MAIDEKTKERIRYIVKDREQLEMLEGGMELLLNNFGLTFENERGGSLEVCNGFSHDDSKKAINVSPAYLSNLKGVISYKDGNKNGKIVSTDKERTMIVIDDYIYNIRYSPENVPSHVLAHALGTKSN